MRRDVSWQRIMIAVLIGCAVFASAKFAFGFKISIDDISGMVISLAVVFGLAAVILVFRDKVTLRPNMSAEEREVVITRTSNRLFRGWAIAFFIMALVALPLHAFGLEHEPLLQRLLYVSLVVLIVINFLLSWRNSRIPEGLGKGGSASRSSNHAE